LTGFTDLYTEGDTFLHRMDPRVKIAAVVLLSLLAFVLTELRFLVILLGLIFLLLLMARARLAKTVFALKFVLRLMLLIAILWPFFDQSGTNALFSIGPIDITEEAIWRGATSAVRVGCLAAVWYILMFTTSQRDLVLALVRMGLRFDYGLTVAITLRFFPTFVSIIDSITDAQKARGLELDRGNIVKRSRNYVAVLVPAIVTALRTSDALSLALQSRAYGARTDRTYVRELHMRATDYAALAIFVVLLLVPVAARYVFSVSM
jgi:energy-coupling factor transport system permease protein